MNKQTQFLIILGISSLLIACGGGGGGSSDSSTPDSATPPASPPVQEDEPPAPEVESTSELVTTEEFVLNANAVLSINVTVSELEFSRAYLNICRSVAPGEINYDDCLVKTPMRGGVFDTEITLGNDVDSLEMEIWRYSVEDEPFRYTWRRESGLDWSIGS